MYNGSLDHNLCLINTDTLCNCKLVGIFKCYMRLGYINQQRKV